MPTKRAPQSKAKQEVAFSPKNINSFYDLPIGQSLNFLGYVESKCGAGGSSEGKSWTFSASLLQWKVVGGPLIKEEVLLVYRDISEQLMERYMKKMEESNIIAFRAQRPGGGRKPKYYFQEVRLELESLSKSNSQDADLKQLQAAHKEKTNADDNVFGLLKYDTFWKIFHTRATYRGQEMWVHFSATNHEQLARVIELAKPLWKARVKWFAAWREHVHKCAFDRAALRWKGDKELSHQQFMKELGWPCGVEFFLKNGRLGYKLQGNNIKLFPNPGVIVQGSTISNFKPC